MITGNAILKTQYSIFQTNKITYSKFWISVIVYSFGFLLFNFSNQFEKLCIIAMGLSLAVMINFLVKLSRSKFTNKYFRSIFLLYMLWQIYIATGGFHGFSIGTVYSYILNPYTFLSYLVPFVVMIPANIFFVKRIFDYFAMLIIPLFFLSIIFHNEVLFNNQNFSEQLVWTLGTGAGFIILNWQYQRNKRKTLAISAVLLSLFISTVMARRNIMLTFSNYIIFSILLLIFNSRKSIQNKILILIVLLLTTTMVYYAFIKYQDEMFAKITERIDNNSREGLWEAFFIDLTPSDFIFGKGFNGSYYAPGNESDKEDRTVIECGYLQMLLKGGLINLVLFLLITIPAIYKGIFKSKNSLSKASAIIVLLWLVDMFPWGMPGLSIRYILLWVCIGICYSKDIANLSQNESIYSFKISTK